MIKPTAPRSSASLPGLFLRLSTHIKKKDITQRGDFIGRPRTKPSSDRESEFKGYNWCRDPDLRMPPKKIRES